MSQMRLKFQMSLLSKLTDAAAAAVDATVNRMVKLQYQWQCDFFINMLKITLEPS